MSYLTTINAQTDQWCQYLFCQEQTEWSVLYLLIFLLYNGTCIPNYLIFSPDVSQCIINIAVSGFTLSITCVFPHDSYNFNGSRFAYEASMLKSLSIHVLAFCVTLQVLVFDPGVMNENQEVQNPNWESYSQNPIVRIYCV